MGELIIIAWLALGYLIAIHAWTRTLDLELVDAFALLPTVFLGPFSAVLWVVFRGPTSQRRPKVILRRRNAKK